MAMNGVIIVLFVCFLGSASAEYCTSNYECGSGECCNSYGECRDCAMATSGIVGIVVGILVFVSIVGSIIACWHCACCPYYRYRHPGTVIVSAAPAYQPFVSVCTSQQPIQQPPPTGFNPAQPPPYYPPTQAQGQAPYHPPRAQGAAPYPPPQA